MGVIGVAGWYYYDDARSRSSFVAYNLVRREPVSSTASIFHLAPTSRSNDYEKYKTAWGQGIWNFQIKQPQIQIVRAYTPLPPTDGGSNDGYGALRFLIRRDAEGELSNYLHVLPIGARIELRGPNLEYVVSEQAKQVVFLAGGTGIAPALQLAHAMFESSADSEGKNLDIKKRLHILWANRRREDCVGGHNGSFPAASTEPPRGLWSLFTKKTTSDIAETQAVEAGPIVRELDALARANPGQITVEYFVNEEDTFINAKAVNRALGVFDDRPTSEAVGDPQEKEQRQIIISGPPGFIAYLAGPKEWRNGREEQGEVTKLMAHALSRNPHNVKIWKV